MASNQLNYTVWLNDQTQKGFQSVQKNFAGLQSVGQRAQNTWQGIGTHAAGLWGVGAAFDAMTMPAREMDAARGELMSLLGDNDVATANVVQNQAMAFSEQYGKSASEFVRASYDIQSAIDGLSANNLATFTNASAVLATATKADTATVTNYMGTMYGIFKKNANAMGKDQWVEQITGQTATAVKMFKTTGTAMNEAFAGVGARAANQGISSAEQFAVLGALQSTMKGNVAGTAYAGFLDAIPNAQKVLGVSLSDASGKAMGMVQIIDTLKGRLGDDLGVDEIGWLNKAFGTNAAGMIQNLWNQTDSLKSNIESLNNVTGMESAVEMASKIADPYEQLAQAINNVKIVFGQALSSALQPFISYMISGMQTIRNWMQLFPNLTKLVGLLVVGIGGLVAAFSTLAVVVLTFKLAWVGLVAGWVASKFVLGGMITLVAGLAKALLILIPAVWKAGAAFFASFGWIGLMVVGAIAAVAAIWYYWDDFIGWLSDAWQTAISWLTDTWAAFTGWFSDNNALEVDTKWMDNKNSLEVDNEVNKLNDHLPDVSKAAQPSQAEQIPSQYLYNQNSNTNNKQEIGTLNLYANQISNPNDLYNRLARNTP